MGNKSRCNQMTPECPPVILPLYQAAVDSEEASFSLLIKIRRALKEAECEQTGTDHSKSLDWYYQQIHYLFTKKFGRIVELHICDDDRSAIALTDKYLFFSHYCIKDDTEIDGMLLGCDRMAVEAVRLLEGRDLQSCTQVLYASAKTLLCFKEELERRKASSIAQKIRPTKNDLKSEQINCLKIVKGHLDYARQYHARAARLNAERRYSWGMLAGVFLLIVSALIFGVLLRRPQIPVPEEMSLLYIFASLICGGVGAAVSVMWRMINGNLTVRHEVGRRTIFTVGVFRPITGALFGLLVFALIQSGLLPFTIQPENPLFFYSVIGFLAGFSERFAPDMLQMTEKQLQNGAVSSTQKTDKTLPPVFLADNGYAKKNGRVKLKTKDDKEVYPSAK